MEGVRTRSQSRKIEAPRVPQKAEQKSGCESLPVEIVTDILHRVAKNNFQDLFRVQQVCRLWRCVSYTVPDIQWCVSSKDSGSALVHFLKARLHSGAPIKSVSIRLARKGLVEAPLGSVVAALAAFPVHSCEIEGPDRWGVDGIKQWGQAGTEAVEKGSLELFRCIPALVSITALHLQHFRNKSDQASIQEPLLVPFTLLRVLILKKCYLKRVDLEQLVNSSPNLEEARLEGHHFEEGGEEEENVDPPPVHIVSRSLQVLYFDQRAACRSHVETYLALDAPNLTTLELHSADCYATLKTPKLVELLMYANTVISTASLKHVVELTLQGWCYIFDPQIPDILNFTPHLTKLCILSLCDEYQEPDIQLLDLDALLPLVPRKVEHLVLSGEFLKCLRMRQAASIVNKSVVEIVIPGPSMYLELDGSSEIEALKRRLKMVRKAFLGIQKVLVTHFHPRSEDGHVQSIMDIFHGVDYVEVKGDGWVTSRRRGCGTVA